MLENGAEIPVERTKRLVAGNLGHRAAIMQVPDESDIFFILAVILLIGVALCVSARVEHDTEST